MGNFKIKLCLLVFIGIFGNLFCKADSLVGILEVQEGSYFLNQPNNSRNKLKAFNQFSQRTLARLKSKDLIVGNGQFVNEVAVLQSIDFVGLADLIGAWATPQGEYIVNFNSFSLLWARLPQNILPTFQSGLEYTLSPAPNGKWRLLMSNQLRMVEAIIDLNDNKLTMEFLDNNSGDVISSLKFEKKQLSKTNAVLSFR